MLLYVHNHNYNASNQGIKNTILILFNIIIALDNSPCTHNQFRLWSAYDTTPEHEGLMQICKYGTWYTIHDYSSCDIGRVVCKSLGYTGARGNIIYEK